MSAETARQDVRPRAPSRKSIATVCLSGTLPDKLEAAAAAGFDGVEIFENDLLTFDGSPADVRRMCDDLGLAITIYQPFRDFEAMPEPQRARNLDRAERKFDVMQALGADLLLVCSNVQPAALDDDARAALQRHALLYDRDGGSEFWHLYTDAFQERFFFEAVQREGGYAGFGAANAPVRAAAQARQHPGEAAFL